jgi:hypothetical protein
VHLLKGLDDLGGGCALQVLRALSRVPRHTGTLARVKACSFARASIFRLAHGTAHGGVRFGLLGAVRGFSRPPGIGLRALVHARVRERLRTRSRSSGFWFITPREWAGAKNPRAAWGSLVSNPGGSNGFWFKSRLPGSRAQPAV